MSAPPRVYINTNIIRDLMERREQSSLFLQELANGGEYILVAAAIFIDETFLSLSRQARERIKAGAPPHEVLAEKRTLMNAIIDVIKLEGLQIVNLGVEGRVRAMVEALDTALDLRLDAYDALHVVLAAQLETNFLATRDRDLLRKRQVIYDKYGVMVVEPKQLVPAIYWSLEKVRGMQISEHPPCINGCLAEIRAGGRPSDAALILLSNYLRRCLDYGREEIHETLRTMRGYDPRKTNAALAKYVPLIWWCINVKESAPEVCPYAGQEDVCNDARPLPEDEKADRDVDRVEMARARPSPFYYFIRRVRS